MGEKRASVVVKNLGNPFEHTPCPWAVQSDKLAEFARRGWVIEMPTPNLSQRPPHTWHGKAWRLDEIDDHTEIPKAKAPDEYTARQKLIEAIEAIEASDAR